MPFQSNKKVQLIFYQIEQQTSPIKDTFINYLIIARLKCLTILIQPQKFLLYKPNDRLISIMSHFATSSQKHLKKEKYTANIQQPQTQQKQFYPSLLYQKSPRQLNTAFSSHNFLGFKETPNISRRETLQTILKTNNVQRNLFNEPCDKPKEIKNSLEHQKQQKVNISNKQPTKPKISFSYKRTENILRPTVPTLPQSCGNQRKEKIADKVCIEQFVLPANKRFKPQREKNLKICSKQLDYLIMPQSSQRSNKKNFFVKEKSFSHSKKLFKGSDSYNLNKNQLATKNKESKIASTVATRSFQTENCFSDASYLMNDGFNSSSYLNSTEKLKSPLIDRLEPSKLLKETIIQSKYDFGGIVKPQFDSCKKQTKNQNHGQESNKWRSYVKCLFDENEDLKNSIHCGPDVRENQEKYEFLIGFGKQIKESCFADHQS